MKNKVKIIVASICAVVLIGTLAFSVGNIMGRKSQPIASSSQSEMNRNENTKSEQSVPENTQNAQQAESVDTRSFKVNENGDLAEPDENDLKQGNGIIARVNADTQKAEYSTDGGKTWSTERPDGV